MERITGIGGFFFRTDNESQLESWYEQHLGIRRVGEEYGDGSWWQDEGPTVFGPDSSDSRLGASGRAWRINFRVRDLDAMVEQLRSAGIEVEVEAEPYPNGRFAHLCDPEGNEIELWQPDGPDLQRPSD